MKLFNSGERFLPGTGGITDDEHMHRYLLAMECAAGLDVLDVASGEGYGSNLLAGVARSVVGVDISEDAVFHASEKYHQANLRYLQGDCVCLPINSASVDLVVSFETIEHHDQHEAMLREIRRVLRPDGVLLISSPNRPEYNRILDEPNPYHVKELDYQEFVSLLDAEFAHVGIYGQYGSHESIVLPYELSDYIKISSVSSEGAYSLQNLIEPVYFIAVAGNTNLPKLRTSVYQNQKLDKSVSVSINLDVMVYFSEMDHDEPTAYSQSRSIGGGYVLDGERTLLRLVFPSDLRQLAKLRLDIANLPAAILLHKLEIQNSSGETLWAWDRKSNLFKNSSGLVYLPYADSAYLLCVNNDPQADLDIPQAAMSQIKFGNTMILEFTPEPLLDVLPTVFSLLQAGISKTEDHGVVSFPQRFVTDLEALASLMKNKIIHKNEIIFRQEAQLEILREQMIRAEAQLDLLKDVMLSSREAGRL